MYDHGTLSGRLSAAGFAPGIAHGLAEILLDIARDSKAEEPGGPKLPVKTRGQEVAEKAVKKTASCGLSGPINYHVQCHTPGAATQLFIATYDTEKGRDVSASALRYIIANLIDAERADAAKVEREACAKEPGKAMRDYWDSCVAPPPGVQTIVTQIERSIRARQ